jgi:hypothetical protein
MNARLQIHVRRPVEVAALVGAYILFLAVGVYSGQTTMNVDLIGPPDGMRFQSSPVELVVKVTVRDVPISEVEVRFTIYRPPTGEETSRILLTDADGLAMLILPAKSGDYTWTVAAMKAGYPRIVSSSRGFSIRLSLVVDALLPSLNPHIVAVSPVDFKARVTDMKGGPVQSAEVSFYVDSTRIGSSVTDSNGLARLSSPVASGTHRWFASANKEDEGGISDTTVFVVA